MFAEVLKPAHSTINDPAMLTTVARAVGARHCHPVVYRRGNVVPVLEPQGAMEMRHAPALPFRDPMKTDHA
jgi:hypothetical protein